MEIDRKSLTFFRNIIKDKSSLEFDICERQLVVKGSKSRSWLIYIAALLTKYNLPAPEHMLYSTPTKVLGKHSCLVAYGSIGTLTCTVQITFIFIDFRVCDFAFKTQNAPCVSRFKRVLFSDRFQFAF